jgi:hypothetical protein
MRLCFLLPLFFSSMAAAQSLEQNLIFAPAQPTVVPGGVTSLGTLNYLQVLYPYPALNRIISPSDSIQLRIKGALANGFVLDMTRRPQTIYSTTPAEIINVNAFGNIMPLSQGTALVQIQNTEVQGSDGYALVNVNYSVNLSSISVDIGSVTASSYSYFQVPSLNFFQYGLVQRLHVFGYFSDGLAYEITSNASTHYSSQNPAVATVDALGLVSVVGPGNTVINISNTSLSTSVPVNVEIAQPFVGISLSAPTQVLRSTSATQQMTLTGITSGSTSIDLTNASAGTSYQVVPASVATVSANGMMAAVASGVAQVTAQNNGFTSSSTIHVDLAPLQALSVTPNGASIPLSSVLPTVTQYLKVIGQYSDGTFSF